MGEKWFPTVPTFDSLEEERQHRKQRLAAGYRLFAKFGFEEGVAGHITARDPIEPDTFWVNPFVVPFAHVKASDLIRVDHSGEVVEGNYHVNTAAFAIHSQVHPPPSPRRAWRSTRGCTPRARTSSAPRTRPPPPAARGRPAPSRSSRSRR